MMDRDNIKKTLNSPITPDDLAKKIRLNWQSQQVGNRSEASRIRLKLFSAVAGFLVVTFIVFQLNMTPKLVLVAWSDVVADEIKDIGLSIPLADILADEQTPISLQNITVKMTKICRLEYSKALHMKIAVDDFNSMDVFIKKGVFDIPAWQSSEGQMGGIRWKIINPNDGLSVLVFYEPDMEENKVNSLVQRMFYS